MGRQVVGEGERRIGATETAAKYKKKGNPDKAEYKVYAFLPAALPLFLSLPCLCSVSFVGWRCARDGFLLRFCWCFAHPFYHWA